MTLAEFAYTMLLRPKPLKASANAIIRLMLPRRLRRHGATVVLNPRDPVVSGALTLGVYEKPETKFFCAACRPGMTFLDVGANVGYYTALAISRIGKGRIVALEPDAESFRYLEQTVAANGATNVACVRKGAAAHDGVLTLHTSSLNRGDNRLYANQLADDSAEVETCRVDTLLSELGIESVDLIKMDVQGFEGHVLRGMRNTLARSSNFLMLMEFWPLGLRSAGTDPTALLLELEQTGARLFELTSRGTLLPLIDKHDVIARHQGRRYTNIVASRGAAVPPRLEPRR
jgi:FkbM family methyltransferase